MRQILGIPAATFSLLISDGRIKPYSINKQGKRTRYLFIQSQFQEIKGIHQKAISIEERYKNVRTSEESKLQTKIRNAERVRQYMRRLWIKSPYRRIIHKLRSRMWKSLTRCKLLRKSPKTEFIIGCTVPELRRHFESLFTPEMNWDNYGIGGWVIDHKIPCDQFDLTQQSDVLKCFHFSNLQPLWDIENRKKANKFNPTGCV